MNNLKSRSKSSLFLMELIIVLMFFSLCAATCMQVFASAKVKTDDSRNLTCASFEAESVAEIYQAYNGDLDAVAKKMHGTAKGNTIEVYYNDEWDVGIQDNAAYTMIITETESEIISKAFIEVKTIDGEEIFEIVSTVINEEVPSDAR